MRIAILGGTGSFGRALGARLRRLDYEVAIGSRDAERAREIAAVLGAAGATNEEAVVGADLVVLATRSGAAIATARAIDDAIGDTPVLCVASDLRFAENGVLPARDSISLAEELAQSIRAPVASGLQSLSAYSLEAAEPPDQDALICGDAAEAKELALEVAGRLVAGRAIDAGPLANSRGLEAMTAVILNVNKRYGGHAGIRLTGIP